MRTILIGQDSHHSADDLLAIAHSPVLYQRPNSIDRFTDVPLLMYYEISHPNTDEVLVRYTTIFTNEDGGTPSAALMARWGRASDIEWTYEVRIRGGQIIKEQFQGVSHETREFKGARFNGAHPLLAVASDNNNFSDQIQSGVQFALFPIAADLQDSSRETIMDRSPWTYRIVAEELSREGKVKGDPVDINTIADPRNYIYVDLSAAQDGTSLSVEVKSPKQSNASLSDFGEPRLRIERSGTFRTAIRLASPESVTAVSTVVVHCFSATGHECKDVQVKGVSYLSRHYQPRFLKFQSVPKRNLKTNETLVITGFRKEL
jgi:hypothetical protein